MKARCLRRRYPLLPPGRNLDDLEARIAFHLHRLGLTGSVLSSIAVSRQDQADLSAGRTPLTPGEAVSIAERLGVGVDELTRPLDDPERADWQFYQRSARAGGEVWRRALEAAEAADMTIPRLAEVIGLDARLLRRILTGNKKLVLTRSMAVALGEATGRAPEDFLPEKGSAGRA